MTNVLILIPSEPDNLEATLSAIPREGETVVVRGGEYLVAKVVHLVHSGVVHVHAVPAP